MSAISDVDQHRHHGSGAVFQGSWDRAWAYECPAVRIMTYTEGQERQFQQMEAADLREWLK